jgi:hypothetical protein
MIKWLKVALSFLLRKHYLLGKETIRQKSKIYFTKQNPPVTFSMRFLKRHKNSDKAKAGIVLLKVLWEPI